MKNMKLACLLQFKDEANNGNLDRYLDSISRYADLLIAYDDGSTDTGLDLLMNWYRTYSGRQLKQVEIIEGGTNDYAAEVAHKDKMLRRGLEMGVTHFMRIDADECLEAAGETGIREWILSEMERPENGGDFDSAAFRNANLWRHPSFYRLDSQFNDFISCRLWKNNGKLEYKNIKRGLHQRAVPDGLEKETWCPYITLHYGFASSESILHKYHMYKAHGQDGWALQRLVDERTLSLGRSQSCWFRNPPEELPISQVINKPLVSML